MISAIILTYNEENILSKCLEALNFVDSIIVFDSYSTDCTLVIAKSYKANIVQRKFDNYANQRNAALASVPKHFDWILMVDADEIVTDELKEEILEKTKHEKSITMYRVRRKDMFQGKWIRQSSGYPTWFPRLFKNGTVTVQREINEEYVTTGNEGRLNGHLIHYPFNKGLEWWVEKHKRYAKFEAKKMLEEMEAPLLLRDLIRKDPVKRRKAQKRLSYRLPLRPHLVFFAFYVLKGGFLNGKAGYTFCMLRKSYEIMIDREYKTLKSKSLNIS